MADRNGYIGRAPSDSAVTVARQTFTPTGVTTDFTFQSGYTPGYFDLFLNGVKMIEEVTSLPPMGQHLVYWVVVLPVETFLKQ